jgi:4-amino-4-deoxy-L-arabinose transferase-like glycosyltransferase
MTRSSSTTIDRRDAVIVGAILAVAFAARVAVLVATRHSWRLINDGFDYSRIAESIATDHGFGNTLVPYATGPSAFRTPLYPALIAPIYRVIGVSWTAARFENVLFGTAAVAAIGVLAYAGWGRRLAVVAMVIAAVYPPLWLDGSGLQYEVLLVTLDCLALAAGIVASRRPERPGWLVLTGVLIGLGVLTRETAAFLLVPIAVLLWRLSGRAALGRIALLVAVSVAVVAPWTIRNLVRLHAFVPVSSDLGFAVEGTYNTTAAHDQASPTLWIPPYQDPSSAKVFTRGRSEVSLEDALQRMAVRYVEDHPTYPAKVVVWNTIRMFGLRGFRDDLTAAPYIPYDRGLTKVADLAFYLVGLAAVAGAFTAAARSAPWPVWLAPAILFVVIVLVSGNIRYRAPLEPFFVILAAAAALTLFDRSRASA